MLFTYTADLLVKILLTIIVVISFFILFSNILYTDNTKDTGEAGSADEPVPTKITKFDIPGINKRLINSAETAMDYYTYYALLRLINNNDYNEKINNPILDNFYFKNKDTNDNNYYLYSTSTTTNKGPLYRTTWSDIKRDLLQVKLNFSETSVRNLLPAIDITKFNLEIVREGTIPYQAGLDCYQQNKSFKNTYISSNIFGFITSRKSSK
jgi:hypothetical protein